ncbi:LysM peptidoglycan-binding domain-containing protein, partial [Streptococcus anginosus]|nr:LysM peptidoglycan-binding domain-containing protein [Streptococcus anginosus]
YGTTYQQLAALNGISNPNYIYVGQVLRVVGQGQSAPQNVSYHTAQWGDTLSGLAARYGTTVENIQALNGLSSDLIYAGVTYRVK